MLNTLLTAMLIIMPLFVCQKNTRWSGLHIGLWVSLFFWGKLHAALAIIVFSAAAIYCWITTKESSSSKSAAKCFPSIRQHIHNPARSQAVIFSSSMMIFCAFGDIYTAYGTYLHLPTSAFDAASAAVFASSIAGPVLFGILSDKTGPFPAMMMLLFAAGVSIAVTAAGHSNPWFFPLGSGLLWLSISGFFVLLPVFMLHFFGRLQLIYYGPSIVLSLSALWGFFFYLFQSDTEKIQNAATNLTFITFLLLFSALFAFLAWQRRLFLIK